MNRNGPWIALDCGWARNAKLRKVKPLARLLYVIGICHCGDELTDGHISPDALPLLWPQVGVSGREGAHLIRQLEQAGLWIAGDHGWDVKDYLEWNWDRATWLSKRERNADRQRNFRARASSQAETPESNGDRNALRTRERARSESESERTTSSGYVKNLNRYTGCKLVRGSHGFSHVRAVLGTDRPPVDWPFERPSRAEIVAALSAAAVVEEVSAGGEVLGELGDVLRGLG